MKAWIARDENDALCLYKVKPWRDDEFGLWMQAYEDDEYMHLSQGDLFPEVKWEDEEPTEVEIQIVKK